MVCSDSGPIKGFLEKGQGYSQAFLSTTVFLEKIEFFKERNIFWHEYPWIQQ